MLTIENITKLYKRDVGEWRIGKIETLSSTYLFHLYKFNRREKIQVNLERTPIGGGDVLLYELWRWNAFGNQSPHPNSVPYRRMLDRSKLETPDGLINEIKELLK